MRELEKKIVIALNHYRWPALDFASEVISNIGFLIVCWVTVILVSISIDYRMGLDVLWKIMAVFVLHYIISEGIIKFGAKKLFLIRLRPYVAYPEEIRGIGKNFSDSSFPSSHISSVVGGLVILYSFFPFAWPALVAFALLLSLSRLHNGMHYPTDILAGIILGLFYGWATLFLMRALG